MTSTTPADLLDQLWGKARPEVGGWHPALLHMLDVAAVALELLERGLSPALVDDLRAPTMDATLTDEQIALLVACHDLGKLSPGFQAKVPERKAALIALGFPFPDLACTDHAAVTVAVGSALLGSYGLGFDAAALVAMAVGAHHGRLHTTFESRPENNRYGGGPWRSVRAVAVARLAAALDAAPLDDLGTPREAWLMAMAGLTVVADWIGSDVAHFPYEPARPPSPAYVAERRAIASALLTAVGWRGWAPTRTPPSFSELFPTFTPNAMQRVVADRVAALTGPSLLIVEASTGGGKTEAALFAAEVQIARAGLGGIYFALPTQATSNQMFGRVRSFLAARYPRDVVDLHLLHAMRDLQEGYAELRATSVDGPGSASADAGAIVANAWFHGKKRGLLSPFAVGTVDQALLAALQVKHFQLRMLGLARKVLIIDEVHAYDAFMSRILDRLLTWLAALGSSVVILSATLPRERRRQLVEAWLGHPVDDADDHAYPRVTSASSGGVHVQAIALTPAASKTTHLSWVGAAHADIAASLVASLAGGGCAAWLCNTVGSAQDAYRALLAAGWSASHVILFHARFPVSERLEHERLVLGALDPESQRPERLIVVATQVVEQSLDIDFDVMVTELAPVDLLIQRAGRVHRHSSRDAGRPAAFATPRLWIAVDTDAQGQPDFGASKYVYHPHILLRTWVTLLGRDAWHLPAEADHLIEAVYGPAASPPAPPWLPALWEKSAADLALVLARASAAASRHLVPMPSEPGSEESFLGTKLTQSLDEPDDAPELHRDLLARTRDIEASVTVICLCVGANEHTATLSPTDPSLVPLRGPKPDHALTSALIKRSVSIQNRGWLSRLFAIEPPPNWKRVPQLRGARPVLFSPDGDADLDGRRLRLDPALGLILNHSESP